MEVFSWEPILCHDNVDVGWSRLSDMDVNEGKLLGCSYNQSCVGIWVVDLSCIEPYAIASPRLNGHSGQSLHQMAGTIALEMLKQDNLDKGMVYPPFPNIRKIFAHIVANVAAKAYELRLVSRYPHPKDFMKYAESFMYNFIYHPYR
ncbi:hypothetical protein ZIOFF_075792 [Zingiber officinale]|uniref:Uncharacterized protein n=1 Tax=Zingiber officinale TaxID=94328 RepID=A0A8J5EKN0_ZINOF|nr:hypothetical protein ZIOFF_075792 [Zingiber officinale]